MRILPRTAILAAMLLFCGVLAARAGDGPDVSKFLGEGRVVSERWKETHDGREYLTARLDSSRDPYYVVFWEVPADRAAGATVFSGGPDGLRAVWSSEEGAYSIAEHSAVLDFDGDGLDEIFLVRHFGASIPYRVEVYKVKGDGEARSIPIPGGRSRVDARDLDGDGRAEIILWQKRDPRHMRIGYVYALDAEGRRFSRSLSEAYSAHYDAEVERIRREFMQAPREEFTRTVETSLWRDGAELLMRLEKERSLARVETISRLSRQIEELEREVRRLSETEPPDAREASTPDDHAGNGVGATKITVGAGLAGLLLGFALAALVFRRRRA